MTLSKPMVKKYKWGALHDKVRAVAQALLDGQKPSARAIAEKYNCTVNYAHYIVKEARKLTGIAKTPSSGGKQSKPPSNRKLRMQAQEQIIYAPPANMVVTMEEPKVDGDLIKFGDEVGSLVLVDVGNGKGRWVKKEEPKADMVNHPPHYTAGGIETIDFIQAKLTPEEFRGYLRGNILKYSSRAGLKGDAAEDLGKMVWYANKLKSLS